MTDPRIHLLHRLRAIDWWRVEVLPQLTDDRNDQDVALTTANTMMSSTALCGRPLGQLLPGLGGVRTGSPADLLQSVRAWNLVKRESANSWEDLAQHSADRLGTWPNAGRKVVTEIVCVALTAWANHEAGPGEAAPSTESVLGLGNASAPPEPPMEFVALRTLVAAAYRHGAATIGEALALAMSSDIGGESWSKLSAQRAADLLGIGDDVDAAWEHLLKFDERERQILAGRVFPVGAKQTLDELGRSLNITRERVRQIERRIKEQVENRLSTTDASAAIEHSAAIVRRTVGTVARDESLQAALVTEVPDGANDALLRRAILRDLAGPYRLADEFWQCGDTLASLRSTLLERRDEPLTSDDIDGLLTEAGVAEPSRLEVRDALPLRRFDDRYLVWVGGLQDKACRVLQVHGEPMSRDELHAAMGGEEVNFRSMANAIQADERFRRLGRDRYGLAAWGGEEYTTIADEIAQAIERRGGRAELNEIVEELVELFGVSAQSVRSYAASRRFHRDAGGALVVAPADAPPAGITAMPAELDRDLVVCGEGWAVRILVDREVMRGSGRPTRSAIAQAAGVRPGDLRTIDLANGSAAISWRATQPALGSTRTLVETLGCADGHLLFLPLTDGELAFAIAREEIEGASGLRRVALELGIADGQGTVEEIAASVGLPRDATVDDVRTRLRARRQDLLAQHLPAGTAGDDDALEELMGLGG